MRPSPFPMPRRKALPVVLLLLAAVLASPAAAAEARKPAQKGGVNVALAAVGLALLGGGGAFAYIQNREADRDMRVYRRSAFSDNTADYRERVEERQALSWAGLAVAALGGVLLVVSF